MELDERIAQWENMTQADPGNDMGWLSLGNAYKEANRLTDAEVALAKAIEVNPGMSRAFQVRGEVLIEQGREDEAAAALTEGYKQAAERGDVMPQKAMGELLEKLGRPLPEVKSAGGCCGGGSASEACEVTGDMITDRRTGRPGTRMTEPPMRGPVGEFIIAHFSQETWREWIGQGTKVINEFRLDFSNEAHQKVYEQQMMEWLGIGEGEIEAKPSPTG